MLNCNTYHHVWVFFLQGKGEKHPSQQASAQGRIPHGISKTEERWLSGIEWGRMPLCLSIWLRWQTTWREYRSFTGGYWAVEESAPEALWGIFHEWCLLLQWHWNFLLGYSPRKIFAARRGCCQNQSAERMLHCSAHLQSSWQEGEAVGHGEGQAVT